MNALQNHIDEEIRKAKAAGIAGDRRLAFSHLERAHILGQSITGSHARVHWLMFKLAVRMRSPLEI